MSRNLFTYAHNQLHFDTTNLFQCDAVKNYTDPVLLYKSSLIQERINWVKGWSKLKQLHYAIKANHNEHILKLFKKNKCGLDVVSGGELKAGLNYGFEPADFIFSGVGKTQAEIEYALDIGIYQINVESPSELKRIAHTAQKKNKKISIGLRVNPLVEANTHPYIATAMQDSKFGINMEDIPVCLEIFKTHPNVELKCISFHIGSQIMDTGIFKQAAEKMMAFYGDIKSQFTSLSRFDIGGGLGLDYKSHDVSLDERRWAKMVEIYNDLFKNFSADIVCELGRFLVARSAVFVSQVQYIKNNNMLVLDLGMNNNMRPSLYQAHHHFYNLNKTSEDRHEYSIVGPICESSDVFHKRFELYQVSELDLLIMADCGAYVRSMASDYNLKGIAQEIFLD